MKIITSFFIFLFCTINLSRGYAQGCATIRNVIGVPQYQQGSNSFINSNWQLAIGNRYYKSFRDFRSTIDLETPLQNESINRNFTTEFVLTHLLSNGWAFSLSLPISSNSRESSLEHGGPNTTRHTTRAFGLGDMRFIATKWLLPAKENRKINIQAGVGLKLPTGSYRAQDYFFRNDTTKVLAPVNPGIQPGDGGLGLIGQLAGYYILSDKLNFYADLYYMASPAEQNGVSVLSGRNPTPNQIKAGIPETSVTDAYVLRAGLFYKLGKNADFSLGVRKEGVPVEDFLGRSGGTRRPGYYLSIDPGFIIRSNKVSWYAQMPFNFKSAIFQNNTDVIITEITKTYTSSPGGSANFQLLFGALINL
jgi:hypothetical protein